MIVAPPSTILVVDDSPTNLQVLVPILSGRGHRILAARDGSTALDIAAKAKPDLMLLDVMMPGMDGFDVCRRLKAESATRDTVVIFLSARGEVADKVSGLELGAIDYITKPIQAEEVLARVGVHLSRLHLERELRQSRDRLDRELASAGRMQRLLLPTEVPAPAGVRVGSYYQTSRHAGGDYYDVLSLDRGRIGILLADVSGHGAPAAIVMAMIRAVVHAFPDVPDDPPALLHYINRHFKFLWDTPMYATALYAVLDTTTRTIRVSSAGHPLPLLRRGGSVTTLPGENAMCVLWDELGDVPCVDYRLAAGDVVLFYTDGITERQTADGSMFDIERLASALGKTSTASPDAIAAAIVDQLDRFASGHEPDDDQTLVVVALD